MPYTRKTKSKNKRRTMKGGIRTRRSSSRSSSLRSSSLDRPFVDSFHNLTSNSPYSQSSSHSSSNIFRITPSSSYSSSSRSSRSSNSASSFSSSRSDATIEMGDNITWDELNEILENENILNNLNKSKLKNFLNKAKTHIIRLKKNESDLEKIQSWANVKINNPNLFQGENSKFWKRFLKGI